MAKPTTLPRWATGATAPIVEPTEGQKDTGWAAAQKPPAQYWNWWRKWVSAWLAYLDGLTNEALTWAAKHTFNAGLATPIAPTAGSDVANKTYVDGAVATHNAVTSPHSATSTPTVSRLVLRDAAGRAQFADPSVGQDAATKAWVEATPGFASLAFEAGWSIWTPDASRLWKDPKGVVHWNLSYQKTAGGTSVLGRLPAGYRPAVLSAYYFPVVVWSSPGLSFGTILVARVMNDGWVDIFQQVNALEPPAGTLFTGYIEFPTT